MPSAPTGGRFIGPMWARIGGVPHGRRREVGMRVRTLLTDRLGPRSLLSTWPIGKPIFDVRGRGELLALTYSLGGLAVLIAWIIDPRDVSNRAGMAGLLSVVFVAAATIYALRSHLPRYAGDLAIVGSLVLIDFGLFFTRLEIHPGLLSPFFVWVGFASPLWFPRRRATLYVGLAGVASGVVVIVAGTSEAAAGWVITLATVIVAFVITSFLTDVIVKRERLAVVGEMASVVGHDLRNPLAAVLNSLYLLRVSLNEDLTEEQERHIQVAEREITKATSIVEHITEYVRPRKPTFAPFGLGQLVGEILEVTPARAGVTVLLEVPPMTLVGDRIQIGQVLTNLVTNALDAVGERGCLRIAASVEGRRAVLTVEDNGPGIEPSLEDRIFEPFYTTKHQGTGLGLAIVRRLIEANGGSITLDHDASKGTRFLLSFPYRHVPRQDAAIEESESGSGKAQTPVSDAGTKPIDVRKGEEAPRSVSIPTSN